MNKTAAKKIEPINSEMFVTLDVWKAVPAKFTSFGVKILFILANGFF